MTTSPQRDLLGIQHVLNTSEASLHQLTALLDCRGLNKVCSLDPNWHHSSTTRSAGKQTAGVGDRPSAGSSTTERELDFKVSCSGLTHAADVCDLFRTTWMRWWGCATTGWRACSTSASSPRWQPVPSPSCCVPFPGPGDKSPAGQFLNRPSARPSALISSTAVRHPGKYSPYPVAQMLG